MLTNRVKWAIGLVALLALGVPRSEAAEIRDEAGLFSSGAVKKAGSVLDQIERRTRVPVVIETVSEIPGLDRNAPEPEKRRAIDSLAERLARQIGHEGVYLLISKHDRVFSPLLVKEKYSALLPREKRHEVRDLLLSEFKAGRFDEGLVRTAAFLDDALTAAPAAAEGVPGPIGVPARRHGAAQAGKFGIGTLFTIGLVIFGVLLLLRLLGGVFNRGGGGYGTPTGMGGMPRPGMGPGYGPGYGGGYGAPRGGFFSGMLGGLGVHSPATGSMTSFRAGTVAMSIPRLIPPPIHSRPWKPATTISWEAMMTADRARPGRIRERVTQAETGVAEMAVETGVVAMEAVTGVVAETVVAGKASRALSQGR